MHMHMHMHMSYEHNTDHCGPYMFHDVVLGSTVAWRNCPLHIEEI